ncbi:glycosyltransferase [Seonamhaeicola sp. ML3]|uniref:glycosyltransferase n=1 Tax=Seonamhaeicola sp. ML3 TaxID=2937786 RepID=UPI00200D0420|nr:glycosyltransferase [Seonamhaeicola sp. ML3]
MFKKRNYNQKAKEVIFKIPQFPHISETFLVAQILTAIKLGFSIKIITRKFIRENISLIEKYNLQERVIIQDYRIPKNKFIRSLKWILLLIQNISDINYIFRYYRVQETFSLTWLYQLVFYKKFNKASIFHIQYGTNSTPIDKLKKIKYLKPAVIVTFHGHDAFFPLYGYIDNNGYYNDLFASNSFITANTPYLSNKIEGLGCSKDKLKVIPVGVNTSYFYPKPTQKDSNIIKLITVGRLDNVKGQKYCIEVVKQLLNLRIEARLSIIGAGEERENLETLINEYKLTNNIKLLGSKNSSEIRDVLWQHDIYLLLAVPVENGRRETQGLATLEAQACGLSAIVFDSGGVKYTVKNEISGFICEEFNVNEVVEKVKYLHENRKVLQDMGENASRFVSEQYSQSLIDEQWGQFYNEIIKE